MAHPQVADTLLSYVRPQSLGAAVEKSPESAGNTPVTAEDNLAKMRQVRAQVSVATNAAVAAVGRGHT